VVNRGVDTFVEVSRAEIRDRRLYRGAPCVNGVICGCWIVPRYIRIMDNAMSEAVQ